MGSIRETGNLRLVAEWVCVPKARVSGTWSTNTMEIGLRQVEQGFY